jgi:endonuclease/exonuclease/phosphatase family metal-dependent hydrolase
MDFRILTYNVHGFVNLDNSISQLDNFYSIVNLLSDINADIVILQEVTLLFRPREQNVYFKNIGYNHIKMVPNGNYVKTNKYTCFLMILSKTEFNWEVIDLTVSDTIRQCIVFKINNMKIAGLHLNDSDQESRLKQLNSLLTINDINIICGDCNFTPYDQETKYLKKKKYELVIPESGIINTSQYNCCDMFFVKNIDSQTEVNVLECDYSDHFPVIMDIKN